MLRTLGKFKRNIITSLQVFVRQQSSSIRMDGTVSKIIKQKTKIVCKCVYQQIIKNKLGKCVDVSHHN